MSRPVIHLIAHTHWDREWYLPLGGFRGRLIPLVDGLLERLAGDDHFPSFYLDGQTVHLEDYLALRPERRPAVLGQVQAGRLRTGPWYVLADEQIPAAESLVRNLLLGRRDLEAWGGTSGVLYSPDAFGHPAVLPQLGHGFGIRHVVLWRGLNDAATDGRDTVTWSGPDGSRLTLYHLPPDGYEIGSNLLVPDDRLPAAWERVAEAVLPRAGADHIAVLVGADHHAADPRLDSLPRRLAAIDPSVDFRWSTLEQYFAAAGQPAGTPVSGELRDSYGYTWTLQGVHGTRAPLKRRHGDAEILLSRLVEPLLARADSSMRASWLAVLRHAWRELVQCQFHDTLGGCAADPIARAMRDRLTNVAYAGDELMRAALHAVAGHDPDAMRDGAPGRPRLLAWNPVPRARGGVMLAQATFFVEDILVGPPGTRCPQVGSGYEPFVLVDPTGHRLPLQVLHLAPSMERRDAPRHYPDQDLVERLHFALPLHGALPGLSYAAFDIETGDMPALEEFTGGQRNEIWNGRLRVTAERDGTMTVASADEVTVLTGQLSLESERDEGDSYTFAPVPGDRPVAGTRLGKPVLAAAGPYVSTLHWGQRLSGGANNEGKPGRVTVNLTAELRGDGPAVHCTLRLDNRAENHRLRLRFPLGFKNVAAVAGAQFGQVTRVAPAARRQRMETPVRTAPAHRWVAAARKQKGLAILAPGFFEYELTASGDLLITVLRSIGELSRADLLTRWGHAGWPTSIPEAQCLGEDTIALGIALVSEAELREPERLEAIWEDLFLPPVVQWERDCTGESAAGPGIELTGEGLVYAACKPAEQGQGMVLRCYNSRDAATTGEWRFTEPVAGAAQVRLDESEIVGLPVGDLGRVVRFEAGPREIVSVLVRGER
jgi:mannosylglycerate hydrolase